MFNRKKIEHLKWDIKLLQSSNESQQNQIWELRADLEKLAQYLRVEFVNVNERRVQAAISKSEEV